MRKGKYTEVKICSICGSKKLTGMCGATYCPKKHGTGKGIDIANQPASIPRGE